MFIDASDVRVVFSACSGKHRCKPKILVAMFTINIPLLTELLQRLPPAALFTFYGKSLMQRLERERRSMMFTRRQPSDGTHDLLLRQRTRLFKRHSFKHFR